MCSIEITIHLKNKQNQTDTGAFRKLLKHKNGKQCWKL